jgi:molybdenum ABC transporter molybdate-binding protein
LLSFRLKKRLRHFTVEVTEQLGAETLVLIGHSGCGKSSTLRMLSGLLEPDEGSIELSHRVLWDDKKKIDIPPENRHIGYLFQNYALFPHLTVAGNIAYGISHLGQPEQAERISEMLEFVGISHLAHAKPAMLSGGEQQRVALARALVTRPGLLLLDEPLSALDVSTRSHVRAELKGLLRKLRIPTIVVTHDFEDARVLADRIAVMDQGTIIQSGSQKELSKYPVNSFVAEFVGTNLVKHETDGEKASLVAFDPWRVDVTKEPGHSRYEWKGTIQDIAWLGGSIRLHLAGEASLLADVSVETFESEGLQIGDAVYARIETADARIVATEVEKQNRQVDRLAIENKPYGKVAPLSALKQKRRWVLPALLVLLLAAGGIGYGMAGKSNGPPQAKMVAFVAANATDPFNKIIAVFEASHPEVNLEATFAGTQVLRTQLEQGAKADLFLSADMAHIEAVKQEGLVDKYVPVSQNHEIIVVPKGNPSDIHSLEDLGRKKVKLIIGTDTVPIGKYTRMIFEKANKDYGAQFSETAMSRVVSFETDVKQVLQKVAMGEAEAGIVYRTDVTASFANKVSIIEIPEALNVKAVNYIATLNQAPHPGLAQELMDFMLAPEGQQIFADYLYEKVK